MCDKNSYILRLVGRIRSDASEGAEAVRRDVLRGVLVEGVKLFSIQREANRSREARRA